MSLDARFLAPGQKRVPGILGGLGPLSHVHFERILLSRNHLRGAHADQQHPVWVLASASSTPERSRALLSGGETALPYLTHFARLLEGAGADALIVVCNAAHAYHAQVQRAIGIPWVHLMHVTAMHITAMHIREGVPAGTAVGILGTNATLATRLYHRALEASGLHPVAPDIGSPVQEQVLKAIFDPKTGIKATGSRVSNEARDALVAAANWLVERGAEIIVPACTEASVGLVPEVFSRVPLVDPLVVAADAALDIAYGVRDPAEFLRQGGEGSRHGS
jgi:aspartate racemase